MSSATKSNFLIPTIVSAVLVLGILIGYVLNGKEHPRLIKKVKDGDNSFGQVEELIRFIETRYVDSVSRDELTEAAMKEVLSKLDPHSVYISPDEVADVNNDMDSKFRGIGIELFYIDDTVNVVNVLENGPANKAGMQVRDKIIEVNDSLVAGNPKMKYPDIRKFLKGQLGDSISVKVKRGNEYVTLPLTIEDIPVNSVDLAFMITDEVGYIDVDKFSSTTYREFMEHFEKFHNAKMKNLIIDLRGNPGGYLPEATKILSQLFQEEKLLLVYTQGRDDEKQEYQTTGKPFFNVDKIAVLVDENSASASELLSGAIQDWDRGIVIGRRTFGKGLVQEQYDLENGGALRLTIAKYYTPSGRCIQKDYSDMDHYYDDTVNKVDSTVFLTKNLNRKVYGGGGITPDVIIGKDVKWAPEEYSVLNKVPQLVFYKISSNPTYSKTQITNQVLEQIGFKGEARIELKNRVESLYDRYSGAYDKEKELEKDPAIKAAFKYFKGEITLED